MTKSERAHYTRTPAEWVAGCSDTGLHHTSNQDAMCIAVRDGEPPAGIIAVADGVSSAHGSELASLVAAETVVGALQTLHAEGLPDNVALVRAYHEANEAVLDARVGDADPSACTLVTAHVDGGSVSVANVGDSRAYWLGDDGTAALLSTDDSVAQARIMMGIPRDDAEQGDQAHAITKWLGLDATDVTPSVTTHQPLTPGWLLLCTDGLWNYASAPERLGEVVAERLATSPTPVAAAEALAAWANEQGGKDNVTVVLARIEACAQQVG